MVDHDRTSRAGPNAHGNVEPTTVHLIEPGGQGGVYQHTLAVAQALLASGRVVIVHTARDAEPVNGSVPICGCVRWFRRLPRVVRRLAVVMWHLGYVVPHLMRRVGSRDIAHVQGVWVPFLSYVTLLGAGVRGGRRVFTPHNTFVRDTVPAIVQAVSSERLLAAAVRSAQSTVVFNQADRERVREWGGRPLVAPLAQLVPTPTDESVAGWHERWGRRDGERVVLCAGQIRADKGLERTLRAAAGSPDLVVAVVGEDKGAVRSSMEVARETGQRVAWWVGYLPLREFTSAIAAADVVAVLYDRASQSGVAQIAAAVGTPIVATDVGGLASQATVSVPLDADSATILAAIRAALNLGHEPVDVDVLPSHELAYGWG